MCDRRVVAWSFVLLLCLGCGKDQAPDAVVALVLSPKTIALGPKEQYQMAATVLLANGDTLSGAQLFWTTNNHAVATVDDSGLVTARGVGSVEVHATMYAPEITGAATVVATDVLQNVIVYTTRQYGPRNELGAVRPDGTGRRRVTEGQDGYETPAISPDGRRIAFVRQGAGIYVMSSEGTGAVPLVFRTIGDAAPAWSPDGSRIAFKSDYYAPAAPYGRIFVVNVDGTGLRLVSPDSTDATADDAAPAWSPDGTRIVFTRNGTLHVVNADGTGFTALPNPDGAASPSWSPDGTRIAFQSADGHIFVANADGSNAVQVTRISGFSETAPRWSPDSRRIVFARATAGSDLLIINADGTGEVRLSTGNAATDASPSWSPLP
ncbi:MAG: hypothetical protein DMD62_15815 [Gemmatimonadetes bacterium]|nr:MAG: hypothetical protein DMD62_15815 [Gemmatimonadota bacterium]